MPQCHSLFDSKKKRWELWATLQEVYPRCVKETSETWDESHDVESCPCSYCNWLAGSSLVDSCRNVINATASDDRQLCLLAKEEITTGEMDALDLVVERVLAAGCPSVVLWIENGRSVDLVERYLSRR